MATAGNQTDPSAHAVHGANPIFLVPKIVREKVWAMTYWKERCFGVSAAALVDLAMELKEVGGVYSATNKATNFLCLVLKMLQIQPEKEIVVEFIKNEDYKYVRLLGAFYLRLAGKPQEVYQYLEPLYNDYRRVRSRMLDGHLALTHVDEFVDDLLTKDLVCDVTLPRIPLRWTLEATGALQPRRSVLEDGMDDALAAAEAAAGAVGAGHEGGGALPPPPPLGGAADRDRGARDGRARRSRSRSREGRGARGRSGSPRARQEREAAPEVPAGDLNDVSQVNALRAKLGMKPLR